MSVAERYDANYQQIAADHVAHWRATGGNPWQTPNDLAVHENLTVETISRYVAPGALILDGGCGMGDLLLRLSDYQAEGCDIADAYLAITSERDLKVTKANLEKLPFQSDWFDLVVTTDVLEHVFDLNAVVGELVRVLKPGGHLVVRVPDNEDMCGYSSDDLPYEFIHLRRLDEHSLRILLGKMFGLTVVEVGRAGIVVQVVAQK